MLVEVSDSFYCKKVRLKNDSVDNNIIILYYLPDKEYSNGDIYEYGIRIKERQKLLYLYKSVNRYAG